MSRFMRFVLLFVIGTLSSISADNSSSSEESSEFPRKLRDEMVSEFNSTIQETKKKCEQKNLPAIALAADNSYDQLVNCYDVNVNFTEMENAVVNTMLNDDITLIPKLFCNRVPALLTCGHNYINTVRPCLNDDDTFLKDRAYNITNTGLNFICNDHQANMNNFISAHGLECIEQKSEALIACFENVTKADNSSTESSSEEYDFTLTSICTDLPILHTCIVNEFRKCENQTSTNIVDTLFTELKEASHCENPTREQLP